MIVHGIRSGSMSNVILAMQARRSLRKGCEAFLALVHDFKRGQIELENILVVKDFPDVFPKELPGIPPEREVDLSIEILPRTTLLLPGHHIGWLQLSCSTTRASG